MDFTLSLAHFCELHGPKSVICTQTLDIDCDRCFPSSYAVTPASVEVDLETYFAQLPGRRLSLAPHLAKSADGERCESCSIQFPSQGRDSSETTASVSKQNAVPFRTREDIHICADTTQSDDGETIHTIRCHSHNVEYISSSNPAKSETFVALRNATVRTLSGEQLPKGQRSGPLLFGDSTTGYTIAYYFRLADGHARGKERYYALLALAGTETRRVFESCTIIWNLFEQIALYIINMAEEVLQRSRPKLEVERVEKEQVITPVSSFLAQRTLNPDGFARRGVESIRANNITELVDNTNFFCELHMMFVKMLQELGAMFGGIKINPAKVGDEQSVPHTINQSDKHNKPKATAEPDDDDFRMSPLPQSSAAPSSSVSKLDVPDHAQLASSTPPRPQIIIA